jgi:hypothetical protein
VIQQTHIIVREEKTERGSFTIEERAPPILLGHLYAPRYPGKFMVKEILLISLLFVASSSALFRLFQHQRMYLV